MGILGADQGFGKRPPVALCAAGGFIAATGAFLRRSRRTGGFAGLGIPGFGFARLGLAGFAVAARRAG